MASVIHNLATILSVVAIGFVTAAAGASLPLLCRTMTVSGAVAQQHFNGRYRIDDSYEKQCSGRQAWTQFDDVVGDTPQAHIYYLEDGYDGWVIAKSSCTSWGNFMAMAKSDAQTPFSMTEPWIEYDDQQQKFVTNSAIKVVCIESVEDHLQAVGKGRVDRRLIIMVAMIILVSSSLIVIAIVVACYIRGRRQKKRMLQQREGEKEVKRNIYIGEDDSNFEYKKMSETDDGPDADVVKVHLQQPLCERL